MASVRLINRLVCRALLCLTLLVVFFNECIIYYLSHISWQQINCQHSNCTRILFIADPQLLGNTYDRSLYSGIARIDSDRYLRKTFEHALAFGRPHIICFLGDLLDEGSVATPQQFEQYVHRFRSVYSAPSNIKLVHIPGDNDIGGENGEYISNTNVRRFESEFMAHDLFDYENHLRFFKVNRMQLDFTNPERESNGQRLRIALTHAPLLIGGGPLLRSVLSELDPHVIFSAHWHESRIFLHPSTKVINFYESAIKHFDLLQLKKQEHNYLEIMVPTASYRMGTLSVGIGLAAIENYQLHYTVLWQPKRFAYLIVYIFWIIFALCGLIVYKMMTRCPFRVAKRPQSPHYSRVNASSIPQF